MENQETVLEGVVEHPNQQTKQYESFEQAIKDIAMRKPESCIIQQGFIADGTYVCQVRMTTSRIDATKNTD